MKRTISKWMGTLVLILATASSFLSTPANANPLRTVQIGGVTCGEFNRSPTVFPKTYWDCITPNATGNPAAYTAAIAASGLAANITTVLTAQNAQIFLFATKADYTAFTGGSGGVSPMGAIHSMTLPAPTGAIQMAAIYSTGTVQGTATSFVSYYAGNILQQLGRIYGANAPLSPQGAHDSTQFSGIFFQSAINDDLKYLGNTTTTAKPNYPTSATVWGNTIASIPANVGKSPWEILGLRYGNTPELVYAYQFARQAANATLPDLNSILQTHMSTSRNWISQQVYLVNAQNYRVFNFGPNPTDAVLCVETNGSNVFPLTWWSCVKAYAPLVADQSVTSQPHSSLSAAWQQLLKDKNVEVYAMRSVRAYKNFTNNAIPAPAIGVYGISSHTGIPKSAAFRDVFTDAAELNWSDGTGFMSGTIMHELGHQFDRVVWKGTAVTLSTANNNSLAVGSVRWQTAVNADIAALNAGGHPTCAAKVDADRIANSKSAVCEKPEYSGFTNFQILVAAESPYGNNEELWARAFARRAGGSVPAYETAVQNRMANMHAYMVDLWSTGAPHN